MTTPSKAAKAAAILCFTAGVETNEKALEIYDDLSACESDEQAIEIMDKHKATVWHAVENLDMEEIWCQIEMLAKSIDSCRVEMSEHAVVPAAWMTFDGEGGYDLCLYCMNESYRDDYIRRNGGKYASWVRPLYESPAEVLTGRELIAARKTLVFNGYTYHGGELWKPPLGKSPFEPAVEPVIGDLRDRLVAISAAIADQDDRAAQAMIREILSSPPPAEPAVELSVGDSTVLSACQKLAQAFRESPPAEPAAQKPDRTGMRYYKNDRCAASSSDAPDCICWTPITSHHQQTCRC